jgi:hypothetical protein
MAERLAALGIKGPAKSGETPAQRAERERKEREDKLRQAEEEDAKREQERQARLQGESIAPPSPSAGAGKPKPPPPAPRKARSESVTSEQSQADAEKKRAENQIKEQALKEQQEGMAKETKAMEYVEITTVLFIEGFANHCAGTKKRDRSESFSNSKKRHKLTFALSKSGSRLVRRRKRKRREQGSPQRRKHRRRRADLLRKELKSRLRSRERRNSDDSWRTWTTRRVTMKDLPHPTRMVVSHRLRQ